MKRGIKGLYTQLNAIIKTKEDENRLAIDVDSLVKEVKREVDIYSVPLDWYIKNALKAAAETTLNQNGYRSVVKGNGLFVNAEHCTNKNYLFRLFNNAKLSEFQKKRVVQFLMKKIQELGTEGQFRFDLDDLESATIVEDVTQKELIEMLMRDANGDDDDGNS